MLEFFANLEPCLIRLEACAGAHYWARELMKLGHEVRLMSPQFVKPYVGHPSADGREISWESPLPSDMTQLLEALYEDARGFRSGTRPP